MNIKKIDRIILFTSIFLFIISLTQESYCTNQCGDSLATFLAGGLGVLFEIGALMDKTLNINSIGEFDYTIGATFSWLANPALILAWLTYKESKTTSLVFTVLSIMLMLSFLMFDNVIDNEAGHYNKIVSYKLGYWLWLSSSVVLVAGSLLRRRITNHNKGSCCTTLE